MAEKIFILLPSPFALPYSYRNLRELLAKKFILFVPTLPASELSFSRKLLWNASDYSEWLLDYMNKKKINKALILGHSNSGVIGIEFALKFPERVAGLVLADTIGVEERSYGKTLWGRVIDAVIEWRLSLWGFHHLLWNLVVHMPNFLYQIHLAARTNVLKKMSSLKVPALILWGKRDHTEPPILAEKLKAHLPKAAQYVSEKGSHDWIITHAKEASSAIGQWVSK